MFGELNLAKRVLVYLLIGVHGVLGLSVFFVVRLPWIFSHPSNLVTIILVLFFATIFCLGKPRTQLQGIIFAVTLSFYLLLLLVYPYTFEISIDLLPSKSFRRPIIPLCVGVLTYGYFGLTGRQPSILVWIANGAISIFFVEWWFLPDRLIKEFKTLTLFIIVGLSLAGVIAWFLKKK